VKPSDLDDPSPVEPDDTLLDRVRSRGGAYRRRQRAQRWMSAGAAAVVVVLAVAVALAVGGGGDTKPSSPPPTTTTTLPAVTNADLLGDWHPVSIVGYDGPFANARVSFQRNNQLGGDDGCNAITGTYQLDHGDAHFDAATSTLCAPPAPFLLTLNATTRVELRNGHLLLFAADGHKLAELVHPTVTARIELPSDTMVAGTHMNGRVVVDNETEHVIKASGCGSLFAVLLTNATYHPDPFWTSCLQELDVPTGVSTYPAFVSATTNNCTNAQPTGGIPLCSPPNSPPPLPPGRYEARLFQSAQVVPDPPAVPVEVVASS
jgi:heat shock protein HslJ